jgi:hypothetical protein
MVHIAGHESYRRFDKLGLLTLGRMSSMRSHLVSGITPLSIDADIADWIAFNAKEIVNPDGTNKRIGILSDLGLVYRIIEPPIEGDFGEVCQFLSIDCGLISVGPVDEETGIPSEPVEGFDALFRP